MKTIRKVVAALSMTSFLSSFLMMGTMVKMNEYYTGWTGYPTMLFMVSVAVAVLSLIVFTDMYKGEKIDAKM